MAQISSHKSQSSAPRSAPSTQSGPRTETVNTLLHAQHLTYRQNRWHKLDSDLKMHEVFH